MKIPFNKPFLTGRETNYIKKAVNSGQLSGNGQFTKKCQSFFEKRYGIEKALLTTSCTDALEMCALLLDCKPGDEVIVPSYTFVSSALAFVRQGVKIIFADSLSNQPNIDHKNLQKLITSKTKAIVIVHYAGVSVDMESVMKIAKKHNLIVIEDAAQAIESFCMIEGKPYSLGSIGHLATFSFHETKNIISGEGGLLAINDTQFIDRAEILWEKGTNRASFFRREIDKYGWVDVGSSFLPSEVIAAFLYAQLENLEKIQKKRIKIWDKYWNALFCLERENFCSLPHIPNYATNNAHMFYLICKSGQERSELIKHLKSNGVFAFFHYQSLHQSKFYKGITNNIPNLPNADKYSDCLVRLPFFLEIIEEEQNHVINSILKFYN